MEHQAYRLTTTARRDGEVVGRYGETVYGIGTSEGGILVTNLPGNPRGWQAVVPEWGLDALGSIPPQDDAAVTDAQRYLDGHDTDGVDTAVLLAHYASERLAKVGDVLADSAAVHANMLRGTIAMPAVRSMLHAHSGQALEAWDAAARLRDAVRELNPGMLAALSSPGEVDGRTAAAVSTILRAALVLADAMEHAEGAGRSPES